MPHMQDNDIAIRLQKALEGLSKDKEAMEEIKDRNLFKKIFSRNTRDLARLGISQNANISELNNVIQDILGICKNSSEKMAEMQLTVQKLQLSQNEENETFREDINYLYTEFVQQFEEWKQLQLKVITHEKRLVSEQQITTVCCDIQEIALRNDLSDIRKFLKICASVKEHISSSWITYDHKRQIYLAVASAKFADLMYDEINDAQDDLSRIFDETDFLNDESGVWTIFLKKQAKIKNRGYIKMSDAVKEIVDATTVSDADRYTEFRNKLTDLLTEFIDKGIDVDNQYSPELISIRKRLLESQFEIALVGEFQGGKSTTFNTLCGGREISPRGLNGGGIKTSAAVITAQNVSDGETKNNLTEWAEITWLSVDDIKLRIYDVLNVSHQDKNIDLHKLIDQAWASQPQREELDRLRIATLQYRLISSARYEKYASKNIVGITDFQELVQFPQNWEKRWEKQQNADFSLEECLFSCIDNVLVRIKSPVLEQLGCRITDCPGLFVSRWDTEKALDVMKRSNAIWYLLSGDKQIGHDNDGKILQLIKDWRFDDKCFLSINRRKNRIMTDQLLETNAAMLKGYGFDPERLFEYNAILSFRLAQIELQKAGFSDKDLECLAIEYKPNAIVSDIVADFKKIPNGIFAALKKMIKKILSTLDEDDMVDTVDEADSWTTQLLDTLNIEAGFNGISGKIKQLITTKKSRSILVDHGTQKCLGVLNAMKMRQENIIRDAEKTLEEANAEANAAQQKLNDFICTWKERFDFLNEDTWDYALTRDFFSSNDYEIRETIDARAREICKEEWSAKWNSGDVNKTTERRVKEEFISLIRAKLNAYMSDIKDNPVFKDKIDDKVNGYLEQLNNQWKELQSDEALFKEMNFDSSEYDFETGSFDQNIDGTIDVPWYSWEFIKDIATLFIRRLFQTPQDRIDKFFEEEQPIRKAYNEFRGNPEHEKSISEFLGAPRRFYKQQLDNQFKKMQERLELAIAAKRKLVESSNEEREKAAADAEILLRDIINPYCSRISEFEEEVCRTYA